MITSFPLPRSLLASDPSPRGLFQPLKKLWCGVGGGDQNKSLVFSNKLINVELPRERFRKLTFRALALCQSEISNCEQSCKKVTVAVSYDIDFALSSYYHKFGFV